MSEGGSQVVPTILELESALLEVSSEAKAVVDNLYAIQRANGNVDESGNVSDVSSIGSCVMFLKKRSALFKFLASVHYVPDKFYFIDIYESHVHLSFRNLGSGQSYLLNKAAYDVIVKRLREKFGWEIYSDVTID